MEQLKPTDSPTVWEQCLVPRQAHVNAQKLRIFSPCPAQTLSSSLVPYQVHPNGPMSSCPSPSALGMNLRNPFQSRGSDCDSLPHHPWGKCYCLNQTNLKDSLDCIVAMHTIAVLFSLFVGVSVWREKTRRIFQSLDS